MFAGHVGAALAIGRVERGINIGILVFAALFLDVVLWVLVLVGLEFVTIPADFAATHQPTFVFPYSHGLLASLAWSAEAAGVAFLWRRRGKAGARAAVLVAVTVLSHWLLDALVHAPELPLVGANSAKVGLGLWDTMPLALLVESALLVTGVWLFVRGSTLSRARKVGLGALAMLTLVFTLLGMTIAPPPPSAGTMAASSLITIAGVCALVGWLGKQPD